MEIAGPFRAPRGQVEKVEADARGHAEAIADATPAGLAKTDFEHYRARPGLDIWVVPRFAQSILGFDPAELQSALETKKKRGFFYLQGGSDGARRAAVGRRVERGA